MNEKPDEMKNILVEKVSVNTWVGEHLVTLEMDASHPDVPIHFQDEKGKIVFSVPNEDIPNLCSALMLTFIES